MDGWRRGSERDDEVGRVRVRGAKGVGTAGRSTGYPAWGSLQPHATLEPSISPGDLWVPGATAARSNYTLHNIGIAPGDGDAAPCRETSALSPRGGFRALALVQRHPRRKKNSISIRKLSRRSFHFCLSVRASTACARMHPRAHVHTWLSALRKRIFRFAAVSTHVRYKSMYFFFFLIIYVALTN